MQPLSPSDRALGDLLVDRRVLSLAPARRGHRRSPRNGTCGSATPCCRATGSSPRLYYRPIAQHFELPFVDLIAEPPDPALLRADEADIYARTLTMPWTRRDGRL